MFGGIRRALARRREIRRLAYALAWHHGEAGADIARARTIAASGDPETRDFMLEVARQAERRHRYLEGLDTATRYLEAPRARYGSPAVPDVAHGSGPSRVVAASGALTRP